MMKLRNMTSVYLTGEQGILCLYRVGSRVVSNRYIGSAGGHFEKEELNDPRACVLREMGEELGLTESDVEGLRLRYITHRYMAGESARITIISPGSGQMHPFTAPKAPSDG